MPVALGTVASHRTAPAVLSNPFTLVAWHAAYWASDPGWTPPADGGAVTTWRDGMGGGRTLTSVSGNPIYRAAAAVLNNKPGVEFTGTQLMDSPTFSTVSAPVSLVAVMRPTAVTGDHYVLAAAAGKSGGINASQWHMYAGTSIKGGSPDTSRHLVNYEFNGAASQLLVDGVSVLTGNPGAGSSTVRWRVASYADADTAYVAATYGFIGFKAGLLTTQEKADLLAWYQSYYDPTGGQFPSTGLVGWWDAADAATFTYSSGTVVSEWRDKSGGNKHLVQGTVSYQPNRNGTRNGKPTVVFNNAAATHLRYAGTTGVDTSNATMFVVAAEAADYSNAGIFAMLGGGNDYDNASSVFVSTQNSTNYLDAYRNGSLATFPGSGVMPWSVAAVTLAAGAGTIHRDGVVGVAGSPIGGTTATLGYLIGGRWVGGAIYGSAALSGDIGEVIVYDRVLSTVERQQVESYLATKWGTPTTPIPTTGLAGWWDASDAATITASGGAVSQWNDKSPNARHLTQATGANQPITGTRTINSKNALDFDGINDVIKSAAYTQGPPFTIFAVAKSDLATVVNRQIIGYIANNPILFVNNDVWCYFGGGQIRGGGSYDTNPHMLTGVFNHPTNSQLFFDGVSVDSGASVGTSAWSAATINVGAAQSADGVEWDGLIAEVIIYAALLSTTERQQVESYLKAKWGTP